MISIHDPIHGTIEVSPAEIKLIDSRPFQRLRYIKQLGFSDLAFPGATHTRYAHSLGAMQMATKIAERALVPLDLEAAEEARVRQSIRLAVLFHDIGHAPRSHVSEKVMPPVKDLKIDEWVDDLERQATHEDYTVKLLVDSELTQLIEDHLGDYGITGKRLAALVMGKSPVGDEDAYIVGGRDVLPLLTQIVSSEVDADRMDYLRRDAYYCGVSYGQFDHVWLTNNLTAVEHDGRWCMALLHKGVWAFENFLLARYHMFLAVYMHHTAICFDHLLGRYYQSGEYILPADSEGYLETDDIHLMMHLRQSKNPWAQAVVQRRPYRLLLETHDFGKDSDLSRIEASLSEAGIEHFRIECEGLLSKYAKKADSVFPLMVLEPEVGRIQRIQDYTSLYRRFDDVVGVTRIYCRPDQAQQAKKIIGG